MGTMTTEPVRGQEATGGEASPCSHPWAAWIPPRGRIMSEITRGTYSVSQMLGIPDTDLPSGRGHSSRKIATRKPTHKQLNSRWGSVLPINSNNMEVTVPGWEKWFLQGGGQGRMEEQRLNNVAGKEQADMP